MNVRVFEPSRDYADVCGWWAGHQWPAMPLHALPQIGLLVESQKQKLCAGWLYRTDSSIAWLEFVVANPASDKDERARALDLLISALLSTAKESGFGVVFSSVSHPKLIERYQHHGFVVSDMNMTNLIRSL